MTVIATEEGEICPSLIWVHGPDAVSSATEFLGKRLLFSSDNDHHTTASDGLYNWNEVAVTRHQNGNFRDNENGTRTTKNRPRLTNR